MNQALVLMSFAVVAIALIAALIVSGRAGRSRLRPLPDESRDRFARSWRAIETRFIDEPAAAVKEADRIAVMILSERGANLADEKRMPKDLREARDMRRAMVHYKKIVDDAVGTSRTKREAYRREMA